MTTNALLLAALALAIALCALCTKLSHRLGIPALALFSLIGMLFGSDGILGIPFADAAMAEQLCSLALVPILFYGGFGTNWKTARPVAGRAILLSSAGVFLTSALTGLFCHLVLGMSWWEGMLMGSVVGSTDATSVFSVLRSHKLNCKGGLAPLLEVESGSNDPFAYILTVAILSLKGGEGSLVGLFLAQVGGGVLCGFALGAAAVFLMKRLRFESEGWQPIFTLALALLIYALTGLLGGNGYLAVYIAGILLGNAPIPHKRPLVHFFDGATSLLQIAIFFTLGLLSFPNGLPRVLPAGLAISLFLALVARPAAVFLLLAPFRMPWRQKLLLCVAGLRGAAAIVFSLVVAAGAPGLERDIFHIIFVVALSSVTVQGALIPWAAKKLDLVDPDGTVLETFTDYQETGAARLVQLPAGALLQGAPRFVADLPLPEGVLIVEILRAGETVVPSGGTLVKEGDTLTLCGEEESLSALLSPEIQG